MSGFELEENMVPRLFVMLGILAFIGLSGFQALAADAVICDAIRSWADGFIFTTSLPPALAAGAVASIRYLKDHDEVRQAHQARAAALKAKGYDYRYVFSRATKHCDSKVFEQTLADTLVWMWRGYHAE